MKKVVIIGGGASGLIAAIYAKTKDNEVIILERNTTCAKKMLVTGNGKCNYWNEDQNLNHYHSMNKEFLSKIITQKNKDEILNFFTSIGIVPKIKNGYYYPFSNQAVTVKNALLLEIKNKGIIIKSDTLVTSIIKKHNQFILETSNDKIVADKVVLATGSKAAPKTGSDGIGYTLAQSLQHTLITPLPSLVQLKANYSFLKKWAGIRTDVILTLEENNQIIKKESGEIQLTDYGISGICTFNLSYYIAKGLNENKKEIIKINFLPFLEEQGISCKNWLDTRNNQVKNRNIQELLETVLNYKLVEVLLKNADISITKKYSELTSIEKNKLIDNLIEFKLEIINTNSFDQAQVCSGGIPLTEINTKTMESLKEKDLYITGELLDVTGDCGGYNLSFAWISGMLAGKAIKE